MPQAQSQGNATALPAPHVLWSCSPSPEITCLDTWEDLSLSTTLVTARLWQAASLLSHSLVLRMLKPPTSDLERDLQILANKYFWRDEAVKSRVQPLSQNGFGLERCALSSREDEKLPATCL
ncbi:uncharacterized protein LOC141932094 isoform X2 [Strix aluco]|uniref:uncharacterized protein LOC141932094 isoform X2 n=1 Tax=Strix aluco TaxID=111821 RepID=UPI003DA63B33